MNYDDVYNGHSLYIYLSVLFLVFFLCSHIANLLYFKCLTASITMGISFNLGHLLFVGAFDLQDFDW